MKKATVFVKANENILTITMTLAQQITQFIMVVTIFVTKHPGFEGLNCKVFTNSNKCQILKCLSLKHSSLLIGRVKSTSFIMQYLWPVLSTYYDYKLHLQCRQLCSQIDTTLWSTTLEASFFSLICLQSSNIILIMFIVQATAFITYRSYECNNVYCTGHQIHGNTCAGKPY